MSMSKRNTLDGWKHRTHRSKAGKKRWRGNKGIRIYLNQKMSKHIKNFENRNRQKED